MKTYLFCILLAICNDYVNSYHNHINKYDTSGFDEYDGYLDKYNKQYSQHEYFLRYSYFIDNLNFIYSMNSMNLSYRLGYTKFTDWSHAEYLDFIFNHHFTTSFSFCDTLYDNEYGNKNIKSVNWIKEGAVTSVKNQEFCGSCWAFSATGALEGYLAIHFGTLVDLSEQQLIDCSLMYGNLGCLGGTMENAFEYIIGNGGLCSDMDYPYIGSYFDEFDCGQNNCSSVKGTDIRNCYTIAPYNETLLGLFLQQQPISIAIEAGARTFQHYVSGIYSNPHCYTGELNHGVLLVGYDDSNIVPYYIIKNSWGTDWGDKGYMYIIRNPNNENGTGMCGLTLQSSFPSY